MVECFLPLFPAREERGRGEEGRPYGLPLPMNLRWFVVPPLGGSGAPDRLKPGLRTVRGSWAVGMVLKPTELPMKRVFGPWPLGRFSAELESGAGSSLKAAVRAVPGSWAMGIVLKPRKLSTILSPLTPRGERMKTPNQGQSHRIRNHPRRSVARPFEELIRFGCPWKCLRFRVEGQLGVAHAPGDVRQMAKQDWIKSRAALTYGALRLCMPTVTTRWYLRAASTILRPSQAIDGFHGISDAR